MKRSILILIFVLSLTELLTMQFLVKSTYLKDPWLSSLLDASMVALATVITVFLLYR